MKAYLEQHDRLLKKQRAFIERATRIAWALKELMRYAYTTEGVIGVLKDIVVTVAHLNIVLMMTRSDTKHLLRFHPDLLNGALANPYLSLQFNASRKLRCKLVEFHYTYMATRLKETFYGRVSNCGMILWRESIKGEMLSICIEFEKKHRREGDLTLSFEKNNIKIYHLSFSIAPGNLIGCSSSEVLLIGRLQGAKERLDEIRRATRLCEYVAPIYLLLSAAQAIALELGIEFVAGVNGSEQLSSTLDFPFDYDSFWQTCAATKTDRNFYLFPASFVGRPIEQVSPDYRRRTRLKRQFKSRVHESVRVAFAEKCLTPRIHRTEGPT